MAELDKNIGISDSDFDDLDDLLGDEEEEQEEQEDIDLRDSDFDDLEDLNSIGIENTQEEQRDLDKSQDPDDGFDLEGFKDFDNDEDTESQEDGSQENTEDTSDSEFDSLPDLNEHIESELTENKKKTLDEYTDEELRKLPIEELNRLMKEAGIDLDEDEDIVPEDNESDIPESTDAENISEDGFELESVEDAAKKLNSIDADHDGSILESDSLMTDSFDTVSNDADFISDTGEIVVMDNSENGDNFRFQYIDIENIAIVKRIRKNTTNVDDLVQSIKSTGLLEPLVVAPTATEGVYVLLAGFRRIMACAKAGKRKIPCIVNIKANIPEIPVLEALYNHSKQYTIKEIVDYIDYLEKQKGIMSASMIEYLLQLNSGDYTKLKDILNDNDDDIVSKLFDGIYTIDTAFKKLEQRRKKESAEEKENKKAARVYENEEESGADNIAGSGEDTDDGEALTEEEIQSLAFNAGDLDSADEEDLQELVDEGNNVEGFKPHKQDYKDREKLDPALRKSVLARDENTCRFCGMGGQEFVEVLDVHHLVEVYLGGSDDINNLVTACTCCHKLIHLYGRGELHLRPIEEFSENDQKRFKRIIKAGTLIRKGMAAKGMKREQLKKIDNAETIGRTKPGTGQVAG